MKRTLKRLLFTVLALVSLAALFFVVINSTGTELNPAAAALIRKFHDHPDPPGNAYYALIGMQLSGEADPQHKGREFAARSSSMTLAQRAALAQQAFEPLATPAAMPVCFPREHNCLAVYRNDRGRIRTAIAKHRRLLEAYSRVLRHYHVFYDTGKVLAWQTGLFNAQQLYTLQTFDFWIAGYKQRALANLFRDISFWRMIVRDAHLQTMRAIGAAILTDDYGMAGEFLRACPACRKTRLASALFAPLTAQALDPTEAREGQFVRTVVLMRESDVKARKNTSLWNRFFYHRHRVINALYAELQDELRLAKATPAGRARLAKELNAKYAFGSSLAAWVGLYVHPDGKVLASMAWASRGAKYGDPVQVVNQYRARIATRLSLAAPYGKQ